MQTHTSDCSVFRIPCWRALLACCSLLGASAPVRAGSSARKLEKQATSELSALLRKVPSLKVVPLPDQPALIQLSPEDSLTIEQLRGIELVRKPPVIGILKKPYDPRMTDTWPAKKAPYEAKGIRPFRFRYFNCEFNYGGWHNYKMTDYAATHGFNILYPYIRSVDDAKHLPIETRWMTWGGFVNWRRWLPEHGIAESRYDLLDENDVIRLLAGEEKFRRAPRSNDLKNHADSLMIDMEHPLLHPEALRQQDWYPAQAAPVERKAFEKRYYAGYAQTYIAPIRAARQNGWRQISLYGWQPYGRTWSGLKNPEVDPLSDFAWNHFGRKIYQAVDIINNSVYCFYWSPQNVAYVLANIDSNMKLVRSEQKQKPVRPYFWTLLHGGGGGWRWWRGQPLAKEEERAITAMAFFTGIDGFVTWNWSGTGSHHSPPPFLRRTKKGEPPAGADLMLKDPFDLVPENGAPGAPIESFRRYDVIHVLRFNKETGQVRFQKIRHQKKNHGVGDAFPMFTMSENELKPHLRILSEPVAAMIEGMALVRPFEFILRYGEIQVDVSSREQFQKSLPISRRVKLGKFHLLITYDPGVIYGGKPRPIVLDNFAGLAGRSLALPADEQTRIFILSESR